MENPSRRCINCSLRLRYLCWQSLREVNDETYNTLASWISPTPVSNNDAVYLMVLTQLYSYLLFSRGKKGWFQHKAGSLQLTQ